jgi:hypothetical protein
MLTPPSPEVLHRHLKMHEYYLGNRIENTSSDVLLRRNVYYVVS